MDFCELSKSASSRSTRFTSNTNIVTSGERTHFVWSVSRRRKKLKPDSDGRRRDPLEQAQVQYCYFEDGQFHAQTNLGEIDDNHTVGSITVDNCGVLNVIVLNHNNNTGRHYSNDGNGAPERWSLLQGGLKTALTYPSVACDEGNSIHLVCRSMQMVREQDEDRRKFYLVHMHRKAGDEHDAKPHTDPRIIVKRSIPKKADYHHYHQSLAVDEAYGIHLLVDFYAHRDTPREVFENRQIAYMKTNDGADWKDAQGNTLSIPIDLTSTSAMVPMSPLSPSDSEIKSFGFSNLCCTKVGRPYFVAWYKGGPAAYLYSFHNGQWTSTRLESGASKMMNGVAISITAETQDKERLVIVGIDSRNNISCFHSIDFGVTFEVKEVFNLPPGMAVGEIKVERRVGANEVVNPWVMLSIIKAGEGDKFPTTVQVGRLQF